VHNFKTHKDTLARIKDREDASFRIRNFEKQNPSFNDKILKFKQQNLDHYSKNFTVEALGVHGKELPQFSQNNKEWWTKVKGYSDQPLYQSAKFMHQDRNPFKVGSFSVNFTIEKRKLGTHNFLINFKSCLGDFRYNN
jgi:hypothetical protein